MYLVIRALGAGDTAFDFLVRPRTIAVVGGTLALAALVGIGTIAVGVPVAWLTTRTDLPGRRTWAVLTAIPLALPSYVVGFAFIAFFGPRGALQGLLAPLGVERLPSIGGLFGAVLVLTLVSFPYVSLATRAALLRVDPAMEESGRLLGDRRMTVFRRITLPVVVPAIAAGTLLAVLYALSDFGAVSLLQFDSLSRAIYLQYGASFDRSLAAVLALVLVGADVRDHLGRGPPSVAGRDLRQPRPAPTAIGRAPRSMALAVDRLPDARGRPGAGDPGRDDRVVARPRHRPGRGRSGSSAGSSWTRSSWVPMAAVLAVVLAIPVALLAARYRSRRSTFIESSTFAGYALPGIVVALSMVFLATRTVPVLYQTLALLVMVYAIRFTPQAIGGLRSSLGTAGPRMEEAGRTLGDGPLRAFAMLTVPYLRPAIVAGAALVFLTVVKELPLALLLAPIGFETLATEIWDAASSGFYARAAVPAALLLVLSIATVAVLLRSEEGSRV